MNTHRVPVDQLRRFFDISLDLFVISKFEGVVVAANSAWERVLGYRPDEIRDKSILNLLHPEDVERTKVSASGCRQGGDVVAFENRYKHKDGSYRWLAWRAVCGESDGYIYAVATDITEAKKAEAELIKAHESLEQALNNERLARKEAERKEKEVRDLFLQVPVLAAATRGPEHVFELANPSYCDLVGGRDLVGHPVKEVLPDLDSQVLAILDKVYHQGERFVARRFAMKADWKAEGHVSEKIFDFIYEPIRSGSGEVSGIWALAYDLTESVILEEKLRVSERMASLGEMAAGIAHEINNPLAYAINNLELILDKDVKDTHLDEGSKEKLLKALDGMDRVRHVVKNLRGFSGFSEGQVGPVDVISVMKLSLEIANNEIRHRAQLITDFGVVPEVLGSANDLSQVFVNMLVNAAQAIPEGDVLNNSIRVKTYPGHNEQAVIEVSDSGCGIEPANLSKVFNPFYTSKPVGVGTGLGLAICHGVVTAMGGELQVESEPGKGSTFRILLPSMRAEAQIGSQSTEIKSQPLGDVNMRKKVLVIDDEEWLREAIDLALCDDNDVFCAAGAHEAFQALEQWNYQVDLILCDVMLPQVTGIEFYKSLAESHPDLAEKIVFMTGGAFTDRTQKFLSQVSNLHIEKPFSIQDLRGLTATFGQGDRGKAS